MKNGTCWLDDQNQPIQAHGGMIMRHEGVYYWYGENKNGITKGEPTVGYRMDVIGISCYSSKDLQNWHHEGVVISAVNGDADHVLHPSKVCERPKVLYNEKTNQFVMWFHVDRSDYTLAMAGCAVSELPTGPFQFVGAQAPNRRDCRDMTLFQDKNGKAYMVHSGDWNKTLYFSELTEDYLDFTGKCTPAMIDQEREAPAMYYHNGLYYCVTSGCTGWEPNSALYSVTPQLENGMKLIDNPCTGAGYRQTFGAQSSYIFEAEGKPYLLLDHWKPQDLRLSGYSILPVHINGLHMEIPWQDEWHI